MTTQQIVSDIKRYYPHISRELDSYLLTKEQEKVLLTK